MNDLKPLALAYAPTRLRAALSALWALDDRLGRVVATTSEFLIGQMRLTWWHQQLQALDAGVAPAEPILNDLLPLTQSHQVTGAELSALTEGWEALLEPMPLSDEQLGIYATMRGERLFAMSAQILGSEVATGLGAGWALIDFAARCSDQLTRNKAISLFNPVPISGPKPLRILSRGAQITAASPNDQITMPMSRWAMLRAVLS